jgi:hypothetical protein
MTARPARVRDHVSAIDGPDGEGTCCRFLEVVPEIDGVVDFIPDDSLDRDDARLVEPSNVRDDALP